MNEKDDISLSGDTEQSKLEPEKERRKKQFLYAIWVIGTITFLVVGRFDIKPLFKALAMLGAIVCIIPFSLIIKRDLFDNGSSEDLL